MCDSAFALYTKNRVNNETFRDWNEFRLLPLVRFYLLGWYRGVAHEVSADDLGDCFQRDKGASPNEKRLDFVVETDTAIELAVRPRNSILSVLGSKNNLSEVIKLKKFPTSLSKVITFGSHSASLSALVLFDFSDSPDPTGIVNQYSRLKISKQQTQTMCSLFSVLYYYNNQSNCSSKQPNPLKKETIKNLDDELSSEPLYGFERGYLASKTLIFNV